VVVELIEPERLLPAPGQAILVLETREDESELVSDLNHPPTEACAEAERSFLRRFGGGCSVPVAALAVTSNDGVSLAGLVATPDGQTVLRGARSGRPDEIGEALAEELGTQGAFDIVRSVL